MLFSILSILMALIPAILLLFFVVGKDKKRPEPPRQLVKAFLLGFVSMFVVTALVGVIDCFIPYGSNTVAGQIWRAFWRAAIPEELVKFMMLWLVLRKNKYFDEHFDGIVYAVMVGLGFATFENLLYMFANYANWLVVGSTRALLTVPAHYAFAVFMGYFYSLAHFSPRRKVYYYSMALLVPMMLHGLYDSLLMVGMVLPEFFSVLLSILCIVLCYFMHKEAFRRITIHLQSDSIIVPKEDVAEQSQSSDDIEYIDYEEVERK